MRKLNILLPQHLEDLRSSGLPDWQIEDAGLYSLEDSSEAARILNWNRPASERGAALVIPYRKLDGSLNGFARIKFDKPRKSNSGKSVKYEQPRGTPIRPYFPPNTIRAIRNKGVMLGITEGEKKALCADAWGYPCIGLPGVWGWQQRRSMEDKKQRVERQLVPDLEAIDWSGRKVWIAFDADSKRNPSVNNAAAEMARILVDRGAEVHFISLPVGPAAADGMPEKMGLDDLLSQSGGVELFQEILMHEVKGANPRQLTEYQRDLLAFRLESLHAPGIYLDRSGTGYGKSYADMEVISKHVESSLTIIPSHDGCDELVAEFWSRNVPAAAYPPLNEETCKNLSVATEALSYGLSPTRAVCPGCKHRDDCDYWSRMKEAETSSHSLATHKRAEMTLTSISKGKKYISIHEDAADIIRPTAAISSGLEQVCELAQRARWEAQDQHKMDAMLFFGKLEEAARWLQEQLYASEETANLEMPPYAAEHESSDADLFRMIKESGIRPSAETLRICKAIAAGALHELKVQVDRVYAKGGIKQTQRSIVATWLPKLPGKATVWLCDATATAAEIQHLLGDSERVVDRTPDGKVEQIHPTLQVPVDITMGTAAKTIISRFRGILAAYPHAKQIGVICHKKHKPIFSGTAKKENLDEASLQKISKVEHFRAGAVRGSNQWLNECDMLCILGTPRVSPAVVKQRLLQAGRTAAAARDGEWEADWWSGLTVSGKRRTVRTLAYRDHEWHAAHQAIVAAELAQAVGRGRSICEHGIPVIVMSTENLGLTLVDEDPEPINEGAKQVLETLRLLSGHSGDSPLAKSSDVDDAQRNPFLNNNTLGNCSVAQGLETEHGIKVTVIKEGPVSSLNVAKEIGISERLARKHLATLEQAGLVRRVGQRGGWLPSAN